MHLADAPRSQNAKPDHGIVSLLHALERLFVMDRNIERSFRK
jgi:hypothetical protein